MAFELKMPQLGLTMEEGTVSKWVKHEGDEVKVGDVVVEITTDKLTNEVTSEAEGTMLKIVAQEGDDVPVKGTLAWIGKPGEQVGGAPAAAAPAVPFAPAAPAAPAKPAGDTSVIVIGGGVIGLELACAYAGFGTKITVVEAMDHMLPMLDGDLTKIGVAHMKKMGMEFNLECPVQSVEESPVGAKVVCKNKAGEIVSFEAEKVLVAIGRKANTASLNLEAGKLDNDRGRIIVNDKMETSVPGVYAIGDCVMGHAQLAHTASAMGEVAAENIMGQEAHYDEKTNPTCVYIEPEAASVGLTEEQCKAQGLDYKVGKFPMSANGKALILNGGEGIVKIIAGKEFGEILGMHIIGPRATDLICEGALAIEGEMTLDEIIATIHSHPTVTETMREAALQAEKRAIHTSNK